MKSISISFGKITSCVLFIFWAMGDPNIQIWHWVVPYAFDVVCGGLVSVFAKGQAKR